MRAVLIAMALLSGPGSPALASAQNPAQTAAAVPEDKAVTALALKLYAQMRFGKMDPALLTPEMQAEFTPQTLADEKLIFDQLGVPVKIEYLSGERHTKGTLYEYRVVFQAAQLRVKLFVHKDGKFAGYGITMG